MLFEEQMILFYHKYALPLTYSGNYERIPPMVQEVVARGKKREAIGRAMPWILAIGGAALTTLGAITFKEGLGSTVEHVSAFLNLINQSTTIAPVKESLPTLVSHINDDFWGIVGGAGETVIGEFGLVSGLTTAIVRRRRNQTS